MKRITLVVFVMLFVLLQACSSANEDRATSINNETQTEPTPQQEQSYGQIHIPAPAPPTIGMQDNNEHLDNNEMVTFIRSIVSAEPLELDSGELREYTRRYVHHGNFHGFIARGNWKSPCQIDIERLLSGYEYFQFNSWYISQYAEMNPEVNLWPPNEVLELVVDEKIVESFITSFVEVDVEWLRQSEKYNPELRGYRFRVLDGLGGGSPLYAHNVWRHEQFIVIEVRNEMDTVMNIPDEERYVSYALIEIIDEESFMYRAYIQLP